MPILAVAAGLLATTTTYGAILNFTDVTPPPGVPGYGGTGVINGAIYTTIDNHPTGTGVFDPFISYQHRDFELGVNTSLGGNGQGFLNDKRVPQWNHDLHLNDLAPITISGVTYFGFELDANETGSGNANRLLSIDDIRIYTSPNSAGSPFRNANNDGDVLAALANPASVGMVQRYAQNTVFSATDGGPNWALIDASRSEGGSTSGSGSSDLIVYVPTLLFAGAGANDFVTFFTINGHNDGVGGDDGSDAGFEEWRAVVGVTVPDGGSTLLLLGSALIPLGLLRARRESGKA